MAEGEASTNRPTSTKVYDIVVFGATGFTGTYVVEEIAKSFKDEGHLKWAIAGRSMQKLADVLQSVSNLTGEDIQDIPIEIADVSNDNSLKDICKKTHVLLNCVGPYMQYGEPVVKACLEAKTHHLDLSGEPLFLEKMQLHYNAEAREQAVYIIGSCGFDSIPTEMGLQYLKNNSAGVVVDVSSFLEIIPSPKGYKGNAGTWCSAVDGYGNYDQLKRIRSQLFPTKLPLPAPVKKNRGNLFYNKDLSTWCVPFVGSDKSVALRTMKYQYETKKEPPFQFRMYYNIPSMFSLAYFALLGTVFGIFSMFRCGRRLMKAFPGFFSLGSFSANGPSREQVKGTSFLINMFADVKKDESTSNTVAVRVRVSGPEPGYQTTPIAFVQAAYVLLKDKSSLPKEGGVYTPGSIFEGTSLLDRLHKRGLKFEIV